MYCSCSHFIDEENEVGRGRVTCPRPMAPEQPVMHPGRLAPGLPAAASASNLPILNELLFMLLGFKSTILKQQYHKPFKGISNKIKKMILLYLLVTNSRINGNLSKLNKYLYNWLTKFRDSS